jgi:transposase
MLNLADLPNDIDALKALLLSQQRIVAGLTEQLNTRAVEIEHLKLQIAKLRRMQFGRKSEKLDHQIEQLELQLEDLQADEGEAAREMPAADQAPRKKSVRRPLPDHLPRDGVVELIDARQKRPQFPSVFRFLPTPACRSWSSCSVRTH